MDGDSPGQLEEAEAEDEPADADWDAPILVWNGLVARAERADSESEGSAASWSSRTPERDES